MSFDLKGFSKDRLIIKVLTMLAVSNRERPWSALDSIIQYYYQDTSEFLIELIDNNLISERILNFDTPYSTDREYFKITLRGLWVLHKYQHGQ